MQYPVCTHLDDDGNFSDILYEVTLCKVWLNFLALISKIFLAATLCDKKLSEEETGKLSLSEVQFLCECTSELR